MRRAAAVLTCVLPIVFGAASAPHLTEAGELPESVDVFVSGQDGYFGYRIPCIVTAPDGSLLAFVEARKHNLADPGGKGQDIDLALKISTDRGRTWSRMMIIEDPGELWSAANAAAVTDEKTKRVWVFYVRCRPGRGSRTARPGTDDVLNLARWSEDNGRTWSEPIDLTRVARDFDDPQWRITVPGPGGAIQTRRGRLIVPCWSYSPMRNFVIYSDDHGETWQRSSPVPGETEINENQVVELIDGRILMDGRQRRGAHRLLSESRDGGQTWSRPRPGQKVTPVMCSIERFTRADNPGTRNRIVWTGPQGPGRVKLTIWTSYDEGRTFQNPRLIYDGPSAYSDLTLLDDGTLGILWERGTKRGYEFITFTRLDLSFIEPR
ncbi:MAG TPA: exo-alpha-sialidase [Planctomycetaceae bacterium]|nr:exo-alpha-sialidase [Planctomycetaceae bacterium]